MTITVPKIGIVIRLGDINPNGTRSGRIIGGNLRRRVITDVVLSFDDEQFNYMIDALESILLAHACAGVDVTSPEYVNGLIAALEDCANQIG